MADHIKMGDYWRQYKSPLTEAGEQIQKVGNDYWKRDYRKERREMQKAFEELQLDIQKTKFEWDKQFVPQEREMGLRQKEAQIRNTNALTRQYGANTRATNNETDYKTLLYKADIYNQENTFWNTPEENDQIRNFLNSIINDETLSSEKKEQAKNLLRLHNRSDYVNRQQNSSRYPYQALLQGYGLGVTLNGNASGRDPEIGNVLISLYNQTGGDEAGITKMMEGETPEHWNPDFVKRAQDNLEDAALKIIHKNPELRKALAKDINLLSAYRRLASYTPEELLKASGAADQTLRAINNVMGFSDPYGKSTNIQQAIAYIRMVALKGLAGGNPSDADLKQLMQIYGNSFHNDSIYWNGVLDQMNTNINEMETRIFMIPRNLRAPFIKNLKMLQRERDILFRGLKSANPNINNQQKEFFPHHTNPQQQPFNQFGDL